MGKLSSKTQFDQASFEAIIHSLSLRVCDLEAQLEIKTKAHNDATKELKETKAASLLHKEHWERVREALHQHGIVSRYEDLQNANSYKSVNDKLIAAGKITETNKALQGALTKVTELAYDHYQVALLADDDATVRLYAVHVAHKRKQAS